MGGGGDDVGVVKGSGHDPGSHQARDVGHVGQQHRVVIVGDLRAFASAD